MRTARAVAAIPVALLTMFAGVIPSHADQGSAKAKSFHACMVTDTGGINDHSFNELTWRGVLAAKAADHKIKASFLPSTSTADYAKNISTFIGEKCGIIVTVGFLMASATETAAKANRHRHFAIVDCTYFGQCLPKPRLKNLGSLGFNVVQDAFLGGYLAAGMSKTGKVATYGGEQFGTVTIFMDGFWDGVQYYNSQHHAHVKVLGWNEKTQKGTFVGSFTNLSAGAKVARMFLREGADVIFPVAGGAGLGSAAAVGGADGTSKKDSVEWPDTDGCFSAAHFCKYFLTSVTKAITAEVKSIVLAAAHGHFPAKYTGTLANGGVALAPYHSFNALIPAALRSALKTVKAKIESGKIVPATKGQF